MINRFQQGGKQDAIMQFVQGLAQVLQADPNEVILVAQLNPEALKAAVQVYLQTLDIAKAAEMFLQALLLKTKSAKHGSKLHYIRSLKNQCADDEEIYYYKVGGSLGCGCKKKENGGEVVKASTGVELFREDLKKKKQQLQKSKWTNTKDNELRILSEKKTLTPLEKQRLQQLRNEFKNSSNTKDYEVEEGKKGMKVEKDCGGSTLIAKFKAKCGAKVKKHKLGGSLNRVSFYQGGGKNKK